MFEAKSESDRCRQCGGVTEDALAGDKSSKRPVSERRATTKIPVLSPTRDKPKLR